MATTNFTPGTLITSEWLNDVDDIVYRKASEIVSVKDFGAVGNGSTDDTAAFVAALATGKSVFIPDGDYKITSALSVAGAGQRIQGNSRASRIYPYGSFNVFSFSGSTEGQGIENLYIDGTNITGGNIISVDTTDRLKFKDLIVWTPWNFAYVTECNNCVFEDVWVNNISGDYGIKWFGNNAARSDILRLIGVALGCNSTARPDGIIWDGNCNTLQIQSVSIVQPDYGLRIINTSGEAAPYFLMADDLEVDFPNHDAVRIDSGAHFYFTPSLYLHGSILGSGIYAYSTVPSDSIVVTGGKITGHTRYGIEMADTAVSVAGGNIYFDGNTLGDVSGILRSNSDRFAVDDTNYLGKDGSDNPVLNLDDTDYVIYNRSTNTLTPVFGGANGIGQRLSSGNPILNFDTNDYIVYNRTSNAYGFVIGSSTFFNIGGALGNYANDTAAAAGGVPLYGYYRNGSIVMQRVV